MSVYALEVLQSSAIREPEPEDPLLSLDSVSITPEQTRRQQRELLRSAQERKNRIRDQQHAQHHISSCVVCDTKYTSGRSLPPNDAHWIDRVIAQDMCRECAEEFLEKAAAQ